MAEPIPEEWKTPVLKILRNGDLDQIEIRETSARIPFDSLFPGAFTYEMLDAFADGLSDDDIQGRQIQDMDEEGTTWAFIFKHRKQKIYGKLCLTPDNELIIIYSAHTPLRGDKV